jgi:hypothetical protein
LNEDAGRAFCTVIITIKRRDLTLKLLVALRLYREGGAGGDEEPVEEPFNDCRVTIAVTIGEGVAAVKG